MASVVSLVIPTIGRSELLCAALASVLSAGVSESEYELIVVDNTLDGDKALRALERRGLHSIPGLRIVHEPSPGAASARNAGARIARGQWLAFIDDDVEVAADWHQALRTIVNADTLDALVGRILPRFEQPPPAWLDMKQWGPLGLLDLGARPLAVQPEEPICMMAGNFAVRRSTFERVGGYDVNMGRSEDHELTIRLMTAGARCEYRPEIIVHSMVVAERMTLKYYRRWHHLHGYYSRLLQRRHPLPVSHIVGIPRFMIREAAELWAPWCMPRNAARTLERRFRMAYYAGYVRALLRVSAPEARLL